MAVKRNTTTPPTGTTDSANDTITPADPSTDRIDVTLYYGVSQRTLGITVETQVEPTSVSERYLTVHLPMSEHPNKSSFEVTSTGKARLELIYDRPMDSCLVSALITSGSSTYDVALSVSTAPDRSKDVTGKSGTPVQAIVVL